MRAISLGLLLASAVGLGAMPQQARGDAGIVSDAEPVVLDEGIRARIEGGRLRPARLVFGAHALTVEQHGQTPLEFPYGTLHIRRGRHHRPIPLLDRTWVKTTVLVTIAINVPLAAGEGLGGIANSLGMSLAVSSVSAMTSYLLRREKGFWLELRVHQPNTSAYIRLPKKRVQRQAIFEELDRRDPKRLVVRPPGSVPSPGWRHEVAEGDAAPEFALRDMDGNEWNLAELRGKVVLLNFWATWCGPCRKEMPHLEQLHRKYAQYGLVLLGVNDEPRERVREYLQEAGITFPNLHSPGGEAFRLFGVHALPTSLVIDQRGQVRNRIEGFRGKRALAEAVRNLVYQAKLATR